MIARKELSLFDFCEIHYSPNERRVDSGESGNTDTSSKVFKCWERKKFFFSDKFFKSVKDMLHIVHSEL